MKIFIVVLLFININQINYAFKTEVLNYKIYPTDNFDIYYPKEQLIKILPELEDLLEDAFTRNTEFFNVDFDYKIPFFIYYGYHQFLQNTIVNVSEETGGVTEAFKNRLLVPYTGSKKFLQHVINHEFIHVVEFRVLYDAKWKTPLLLKSIFYPHWLLEGLAEYRASLFTKTKQEMLVRDMVINNNLIPLSHLHNFSHLKPHMVLPAYEQSAKLVEFIDREYGKTNLVSLLETYRNSFDANTVLNSVLKTDLKNLQKKFFEDMNDLYKFEVKIQSMTDLNSKNLISEKEIYPIHYYSPIIFEDKIIYVGDSEGEKMIYVNFNNKQKLLIPRNILKKNIDFINTDDTRISISQNGLLCFCGIKNNKSYIFLYDISKKILKKIHIKEVDFITSTYITSNGEKIFISGIKDCKSVIYVYNIMSKHVVKLIEDENFISQLASDKEGKKILYTKESPCYKGDIKTWQTDIFFYDVENNKNIQLTNTLSDESYGWFKDDKTILFVSDYNSEYEKKFYGVNNLFLVNIENLEQIKKLTNVIGGISYPYCLDDKILLCYYSNFSQHVYKFDKIEDLSNFNSYEYTQKFDKQILNFDDNDTKFKSSKPYKFNFSTDLFFPVLYYSSYDGFMMFLYWQASDMIGEHNVILNTNIVGDKNYYYSFIYEFSKFRPKVLFGVSKENSYDYINNISKNINQLNFGISYPLDKITYLNFIFGYNNQILKNEKSNSEYFKNQEIIYLNYIRNSLNFKYLEPLSGYYNEIGLEFSEKIFTGDYSYQLLKYKFLKYIHLGEEKSIFANLKFYYSTGRDKVFFDIGGINGISGIWYNKIYSQKFSMIRLGFRIPLIYDINYYMWFLFPDLFLKGFYSEPFLDFGIDERYKTYNSLGIKFKLNTFVLQMYVLKFELIFSNRFDEKSNFITYFNIAGII